MAPVSRNRQAVSGGQQDSPTYREFVDSTAAARLNGLIAGYGQSTAVKSELRELGLPDSLVARLPN